MTRFLQPEWFWLLALLPIVMLWRGRRGAIAGTEEASPAQEAHDALPTT